MNPESTGFVVDEQHLGTPAERWLPWRTALPRMAPADLVAETSGRVVALAPHPDDEILGMGGLLHQLGRAGAALALLAVTDGGAAPPPAGCTSSEQLGALRLEESRRACAVLELPEPQLLGLDDGAVEVRADHLVTVLEGHLAAGDLCLSTWRHDGHPDHEATARAAREACARQGAVLVEYPVWMWHWATPGDPRVPWSQAHAVALPEPAQRLKRRAVAEFHSQIQPPALGGAPVLPTAVLERLVTDHEVVLR